jgi:hypothetical protein
MKMSPQGIMYSKKASNSPGLCPVKEQKPSLGTQTFGLLLNKVSFEVFKTIKKIIYFLQIQQEEDSFYQQIGLKFEE